MANQPDIPQEEMDLGSLFSQIGQMFRSFFNGIGYLMKRGYHYGILLILFIRKNYIVFGVSTLIGLLYGLYIDQISIPHYESKLTIETNYGSGHELYKQIDVINNLIANRDSINVSKRLGVTPAQAGKLIGLKIEPFDAEKELLLAYDTYMQETDTIYTKEFEFTDYKQRYSQKDLRFHIITALAKENLDFRVYGKEMANLAQTQYYIDLKNKHLSDLSFYKKEVVDNLNNIDSLRVRYNKVALLQAMNPKKGADLNFSTSKRSERNIDMDTYHWAEKSLELFTKINKKILRNDVVSRQVTSFSNGLISNNIMWYKFAFIGFLVALLVLSLIEFNSYLNDYNK